MLALSPYAADLHNEHLRRRKRFAEASDRHIERSRPSQASLENSLRALPIPAAPPIDMPIAPPIDTQANWAKMQTQMFAREAETPATRGDVPIRKIQQIVADHYGVSRLDMISERRASEVVRPRQVAMYLAKKMTKRSLPEIGRHFGNRHHSTVHHAARKFEALIARDATIGATINALEIAIS